MKKIFLALDVDGTIYDSGDIIVEAFQKGISEYVKLHGEKEIDVPTFQQIEAVLGIPVTSIFQKLFPALDESERSKLNDACTNSLVAMIRKGGGRIFDGVGPTIESLYNSGYTILVASNGRAEYILAILETFGLIKFFSKPLVFPGGTIADKSGVVKYYRENETGDNLCIMIGDRYTDRIAASDNNIPFIGCAFGHAGEEEIKGANKIVHSFSEIPGAVKDIEEGGGATN